MCHGSTVCGHWCVNFCKFYPILFAGMVIQATLFLTTAYSNCNTTVAVVCFVTAAAFGGLYIPGYNVNKLDIAPNSAAIISAIVNILSTIGGILGPLLVALITGEEVFAWKFFYFKNGMSRGPNNWLAADFHRPGHYNSIAFELSGHSLPVDSSVVN